MTPPGRNSISLEDEKLRAVLERQTRFQLRGYEEELMSQRGASQWPTSGTGCYFSVRFMLDENLLSLRFRVFQQNRPTAAVPHIRRKRVSEESASCREGQLTGLVANSRNRPGGDNRTRSPKQTLASPCALDVYSGSRRS